MSTEADLKAEAQVSQSDSATKQSAIATISASLKTANQVKSDFQHYARYAPKRFPKSVGEGADWAGHALEAYAKDNGKKWGATAIKKVASAYGYEGYVPSEIPTNEKEAADALVNIACVAASSELGVDPRLAKVTVEAVMDGKLDKGDAEAIGSVAGSIAGAALCQTFGIPAPIGAFLGGELGGFVGGEIADIFGASKKAHREWLNKQKRIVAQIQAKAEEQCQIIREGYWQTFDAYVSHAESAWENLELRAGARFDLRWFDKSPTPNFLEYVKQQPARFKDRVSSQSCALVCPDGLLLKRSTTPLLTGASSAEVAAYMEQCRQDFVARVMKRFPVTELAANMAAGDTTPIDVCSVSCVADYGCPYPDMQNAQYPKLSTLVSAKRVTSAYLALGFPWLPPTTPELLRSWGAKDWDTLIKALHDHAGQYRITSCTLPAASARAVRDTKYRKLWVDWLNQMLFYEEQRIASLNSASVRLFGDLTQTAAMVAVERELGNAKTRAALKGLGTTDPITNANSWVNNSALVAGLGWLAYNSRKR